MTGKNNYTQVQSKKVLTDFSKCFSTLQKKIGIGKWGSQFIYIEKIQSILEPYRFLHITIAILKPFFQTFRELLCSR